MYTISTARPAHRRDHLLDALPDLVADANG